MDKIETAVSTSEGLKRIAEMVTDEELETKHDKARTALLYIFALCIVAGVGMGLIYLGAGTAVVNIILGNHFTK